MLRVVSRRRLDTRRSLLGTFVLGLSRLVAVALPAAAGVGCGEPSPVPGGSASSAVAGSATSEDPAPGSQPQPGARELVLEDFSDGDALFSTGEFSGFVVVDADGTGTVMPPNGEIPVPENGAVTLRATGFGEWGVGLEVQPFGGEFSDISSFRGVAFRARGEGLLRVSLVDAATSPVDFGGVCEGTACWGHYKVDLNLSPDFVDHVLDFDSFRQPSWAPSVELDLERVKAISLVAPVDGDHPGPVDLQLTLARVALTREPQPVAAHFGANPTVVRGNPFAGVVPYTEGSQAQAAYNGLPPGEARNQLEKVAMNPSAFWIGGAPEVAGSIARRAAGAYPVLVLARLAHGECPGRGAEPAPDSEYAAWLQALLDSLEGRPAALVVEPGVLYSSCPTDMRPLIAEAVARISEHPELAVYLDGGRAVWDESEIAPVLERANVAAATGFAVNIGDFETTRDSIAYGRELSARLGGKPFVVDTSRNGRGPASSRCNPPGAGLGERPTTATGEASVHALLWIKAPGESDGECGQCAGIPLGQFCSNYALELARNARF